MNSNDFFKIIGLGILVYFLLSKIANAPTGEVIPEEIIPEEIITEEIISEEVIPPIEDVPSDIINEIYAELLRPAGGLRKTYNEGECELAAKEFQKVYGGNLVFIAPYNRETNAWLMCDFCGHMLNRIYYKNKILWVDYTAKEIVEKKEHMRQYITRLLQYKFKEPIDAKVFVIGEDSLPYPMIWHY